ncbi:Uncharacterized protein TCM_038099 [Theobroma cacao]|uniref:Uncharacterized protein n=1 Tax=Theobroma cacao TaxID=3641 RepID=A0A061GPL8_THECC|nr:Uncharacterized protein TCM_038099 [Theobroma cacao]
MTTTQQEMIGGKKDDDKKRISGDSSKGLAMEGPRKKVFRVSKGANLMRKFGSGGKEVSPAIEPTKSLNSRLKPTPQLALKNRAGCGRQRWFWCASWANAKLSNEYGSILETFIHPAAGSFPKKRAKVRVRVKWEASRQSQMNFNVDGATKGCPRLAGIEGLLRNAAGEVKISFLK